MISRTWKAKQIYLEIKSKYQKVNCNRVIEKLKEEMKLHNCEIHLFFVMLSYFSLASELLHHHNDNRLLHWLLLSIL